MNIKLDSGDIKEITRKIKNELNKTNNKYGNLNTFDIRVERYGIPFKVSVMREWSKSYTIDGVDYLGYQYTICDIAYWGLNSRNIDVSYDYYIMVYYGRFCI